jgi:hypothetical protein
MLVRFPLKISALSSCYHLSNFCCRKEAWGYAKVIHKKERKETKRRVEKKWTQKYPRYLKQWVLRCLLEKEKEKEKDE